MADVLYEVAGGVKKKLQDMGDGSHAEVVVSSGGGGGSGSSEVEVTNFPETQEVSGSVSVSNFPATQPVTGPLTNAQLSDAALATAANQASAKTVLDNILTQLQTLNAALVTANEHLAQIETNTGASA